MGRSSQPDSWTGAGPWHVHWGYRVLTQSHILIFLCLDQWEDKCFIVANIVGKAAKYDLIGSYTKSGGDICITKHCSLVVSALFLADQRTKSHIIHPIRSSMGTLCHPVHWLIVGH